MPFTLLLAPLIQKAIYHQTINKSPPYFLASSDLLFLFPIFSRYTCLKTLNMWDLQAIIYRPLNRCVNSVVSTLISSFQARRLKYETSTFYQKGSPYIRLLYAFYALISKMDQDLTKKCHIQTIKMALNITLNISDWIVTIRTN